MNFIDHYTNYSASNEAPSVYHKWACISALSHLIGPRVWTHLGGRLTFYPQMYVLLVGNPGLKKSTAMNQARDLVDSVPLIAQAPASTSKEGIVQLMTAKDSPSKRSYEIRKGEYQQYNQLAIFASELVSLLNAAGNPNGTIEFFTDIWDRTGRTYRQYFVSSGDKDIVSPYISILACLTPETMKNLVTSKVISSGMSRRCLFIYADRNGAPIAFIDPSKEQEESWRYCVTHAKSLQNLHGAFDWTAEARDFYKSWYDPFMERVPDEPSGILRNFYMSKAEYTIKVSMLLAIAEENPKLVHTRDTFSKALDMITSVEKGACTMFEGSGKNMLADLLHDVSEWLRTHAGWHHENALLKVFWKDMPNKPREDLRALLDQLVLLERITAKGDPENITMKYIKHRDAADAPKT